MLSGLLLLFAVEALSAVLAHQNDVPSVTIKNGTVVGQSTNTTDNFLGIPYAQPPVSDLRLRAPRSINSSFGTLTLPTIPAKCLQQNQGDFNTTGLPNSTDQLLQGLTSSFPGAQQEDCLTINVQRPRGIPSDSKLPVLLWIYGGGFETGASSAYDGTALIETGQRLRAPVIFVAFNYRVSAMGFLAGKEMQREGNTNLGIRDQRLALKWVAENIAAFGGDPERVTLWGESAGAVSIFAQLVLNNGDNTYQGKPLFRATIADSGSLVSALPVDSAPAQSTFDSFVAQCGCANAKDSVACLRTANLSTIQAAMEAAPKFWGYAGNTLPFTVRPDPLSDFNPDTTTAPLDHNTIAHVPSIWGNQEDEGTLFALAQRNISTTEDLIDYFVPAYPNAERSTISGLVGAYSDDPAAGAPFRTGNAYQLYPQFKRLAAINGDTTFFAGRRKIVSYFSKCGVPVWSYLATYDYDVPYLGTYHTSDLGESFGLVPYKKTGQHIDDLYVRFANYLDPNGGLPRQYWPRYDTTERKMLNYTINQFGITKDDFRQKGIDYILEHFIELGI